MLLKTDLRPFPGLAGLASGSATLYKEMLQLAGFIHQTEDS